MIEERSEITDKRLLNISEDIGNCDLKAAIRWLRAVALITSREMHTFVRM